jgi:hypothetical protein
MTSALALLLSLAIAPSRPFPVVRPAEHRFQFEEAEKATVDIEIKDTEGRTAYKLACRTRSSDKIGEDEFAGPFDCHLWEPGREDEEPNLLLEIPGDAAFYGRGRFIGSDFQASSPRGADGGGPGPRRICRLRQMRIVLEVRGARVSPGPRGQDSSVHRFDFFVSVAPDPKATNAYLYPPGTKGRYDHIR